MEAELYVLHGAICVPRPDGEVILAGYSSLTVQSSAEFERGGGARFETAFDHSPQRRTSGGLGCTQRGQPDDGSGHQDPHPRSLPPPIAELRQEVWSWMAEAREVLRQTQRSIRILANLGCVAALQGRVAGGVEAEDDRPAPTVPQRVDVKEGEVDAVTEHLLSQTRRLVGPALSRVRATDAPSRAAKRADAPPPQSRTAPEKRPREAGLEPTSGGHSGGMKPRRTLKWSSTGRIAHVARIEDAGLAFDVGSVDRPPTFAVALRSKRLRRSFPEYHK